MMRRDAGCIHNEMSGVGPGLSGHRDGFRTEHGTSHNTHIILSKDLGPTSAEEQLWMKKIPCLTAVGSIMYAATATCPDVAFAIQHLSQFNNNPGNAHWTAAQCTI